MHTEDVCADVQAAGWIVVILFGFIFAILAVALVWVDIKFAGAVYNSEQFNTAGRSIGAGLLAVDIVSHWTWASIMCGPPPHPCADPATVAVHESRLQRGTSDIAGCHSVRLLMSGCCASADTEC